MSIDGRKLLEENPILAAAVARFMVLYDAADLLGELKPPEHERIAAYLKDLAGNVLAERGLPGTFAQAMIAARPPLDISRALRGGENDGT